MEATARIFYQKAPAKRTVDNLIPAKLCITHKGIRKYYSISDRIKKAEWQFLSEEAIQKVTSANPRGEYRDIKFEFKRITDEAEGIIRGMNPFSFNRFEEKYFNKITSWDNVFKAFIDQIEQLRGEERYSYALSFETTLGSVKAFHEGKKLEYNCRDTVKNRYNDYLSGKPLNFIDITPSWLKRYEVWLHKDGKSRSTQGIYIRNIRVIVNKAIKLHKIKIEYPFDTYKPKTSEGRKIALTAYQISQIANYKTEDPQEQFYRDMYLFSFWANGMNLTDIARLKYSNIQDGEVSFVRRKTEREQSKEVKINIPINKSIQEIIDKYGNKSIGFDNYVFPILKPDMTEEKIFFEIRQFIKLTNGYLKSIAKRLKITEKLTTYTARHSWATIAKNSGASTEFIKEALGHSSVSVTENYLKSFEKKTRQEQSEKMESIIKSAAI